MTSEHSNDLHFDDNARAAILFGDLNRNLVTVEKATGVTINVRGNDVHINGPKHEVDLISDLLCQLYELIGKGYPVYSSDFAFG
ncbi:MAG: phosphate starvation-inducible protein PhoH, partial [Desulfopila sp.]